MSAHPNSRRQPTRREQQKQPNVSATSLWWMAITGPSFHGLWPIKCCMLRGCISPVQRHPFHILARRIPQQAPQVGLTPFQLFRSPKGRSKHFDIAHHFFQKLFTILLDQITFRRRARLCYYFRRLGYLFSFSCGCGRRKIPSLSVSGYLTWLTATLRCNNNE